MRSNRLPLAKLSKPQAREAVRRERLWHLLDDLAVRRGVWVCGPPGAGKTTLIASWLEARERLSFWYRVDEGDSDIASLFDHLQQLLPPEVLGTRGLPQFTVEHLRDITAFARLFFRTWFDVAPRDCVLVFDNHHDLPGGKIDALLRIALAEVTDDKLLIVVSRSDVAPPLLQALATDDLGRLGWEELRLTAPETALLLAARTPHLSEHAAAIHEHTGGWAAGIVLFSAGESLRVPSAAHGAGNAGATFAYFAAEVLDRLLPAAQDLLLRSSCLRQFGPVDVARIAGCDDAGAILDQLYREHYFIVRCGDVAALEFRYHDLFRSFLRHRARATLGAKGWRALLSRAGQLMRERGEIEEAYVLWREATDWTAVATLVIGEADGLLARGRWRTLLDWIDSIPDRQERKDPPLLYWYGRARTGTDGPAGRRILEQAFYGYRQAGDVPSQIRCCAAIIESYFQAWDTIASLDDWITTMDGLLALPSGGSSDFRAEAVGPLARALLFRMPSHPSLPRLIDEIERRIGDGSNANRRLMDAALLFDYLSFAGQFHRARRVASVTQPDAKPDRCLPVNAVVWWERAASCDYRAGAYAEARARYGVALRMARDHGLVDQEFLVLLGFAMTALCEDQPDEAETHLMEMQARLNPQRQTHVVALHYLELWLALATADTERAHAVWNGFAEIPMVGVPIHSAFNHPVVWLFTLEGNGEAAMNSIRAWRKAVGSAAYPYVDFNFGCMAAFVLRRLGQYQQARDELAVAFGIGAKNGYRSMLTWMPRMMAELCEAAINWRIEPEYTRDLIRERVLAPPAVGSSHWPRTVEIRTLGAFELLRDGEIVVFARKAPRKPLALLRAIIASGESGAPAASLCEWLWPDLDGDRAGDALAATLLRLRRLLGDRRSVVMSEGRARLDSERVWVDAYAFDRTADIDADSALDLYKGEFLPGDDLESAVASTRERLRARFARLISKQAVAFESKGDFGRAADLYRRGIQADPLAEVCYQGLMRCHSAEGRPAEAAVVYRELRHLLSVVLGTSPSSESHRLANGLVRDS